MAGLKESVVAWWKERVAAAGKESVAEKHAVVWGKDKVAAGRKG